MTTTRLVVATGLTGWQPKTKFTRNTFATANVGGRKNKKTIDFSFGSARSGVLLFSAVALAIFFYLYSVNGSAVKGFQARQAEKEVLELQKQNEQLRIKEAELQSLYYIEESSKKLNMADLKKVSYVEQRGPMALNR